MAEQDRNSHEELEQATIRRLARLGSMPLDATGLERMLQRKLPGDPRLQRRGWSRPLRAAAAVLLLALVIAGLLVVSSGGAVMASPAVMAQMHRDMVAQRVPATKVDSLEEAGRVLEDRLHNGPALPDAPDAHVMACCMQEVKDKRLAVVLLQSQGVPVTMTVARAADMKLPRGKAVVREGMRYHVEQIQELTMVTAERQGRWVCLISELPAEGLMDIILRLRF
jgi:hypothetical protein